jgi:signal transduction histidine kinase
VLEILDDGCGLTPAPAAGSGSGRGLRHMAQRAEKLGAQLTLEPAPGTGLRVRLRLPLREGDLPVSAPAPLNG